MKKSDVFLVGLLLLFSVYFLGSIIPAMISYPDTLVVALGIVSALGYVVGLLYVIEYFVKQVINDKNSKKDEPKKDSTEKSA